MSATPTPWVMVPRRDGLVNIYHAAKVRDVALAARPEDAALICAAVNSHEAALELARAILGHQHNPGAVAPYLASVAGRVIAAAGGVA